MFIRSMVYVHYDTTIVEDTVFVVGGKISPLTLLWACHFTHIYLYTYIPIFILE